MKFDWTFNLGHVAIVTTLLGGIFTAYSDTLRLTDNHELRLRLLEKTVEKSVEVQQDVYDTLSVIRQDIAVVKAHETASGAR